MGPAEEVLPVGRTTGVILTDLLVKVRGGIIRVVVVGSTEGARVESIEGVAGVMIEGVAGVTGVVEEVDKTPMLILAEKLVVVIEEGVMQAKGIRTNREEGSREVHNKVKGHRGVNLEMYRRETCQRVKGHKVLGIIGSKVLVFLV